ncbi:MAG: exodeoxyribonuclease VII large subunit [Candidatus Delongbacteria bacterium]|nr:exodeoxyribonuclease VII large subunit [Candidatus Delongbacteria bacterium]
MTRPPLTVSDLARSIRETIDDAFPPVWVEGEVSNYTRHRSGHHYFSIRDSECQLACVLWRGRARQLTLNLQDGLRVRLHVQIAFYDRGGRLQLDVQQVQASGLGELLLRFEQLKEKLRGEGLFALERKRPLPQFPARLGVVSSPSGAAIQDISKVIRQRFPATQILLYPAHVQGKEAAAEIAAGIEYFNRRRNVDLLIISRGGGSLEDLWPFNDEQLARVIAASFLPVISGVGHEVDTTIADLVADVRAATPSNAAELAVPEATALSAGCRNLIQHMNRNLQDRLQQTHERLHHLHRLFAPRRLLADLTSQTQRLDEMLTGLARAVRWRAAAEGTRLVQHKMQLQQRFRQGWQRRQAELSSLHKLLEAINPRQILERGYALVEQLESGRLIQDKQQVQPGEKIKVTLRRGRLFARVEAKGD